MKVQVRLFARYREEAGRDQLRPGAPRGGTVERAWEAVTPPVPVLVPYRPYTLFALRNDYVGADHPLGDGDELCFFPPVSGGAVEPGPDWIEVTSQAAFRARGRAGGGASGRRGGRPCSRAWCGTRRAGAG